MHEDGRAFAGTVALTIYSVGYFGKLLAESFESLPGETQEALRCAGAGRVRTFHHAALQAALNLHLHFRSNSSRR